MALFGIKRFRRQTNPKHSSLEKVAQEITGRSARPTVTQKRGRRRGGIGNIVVMTLASGLVATMALPAYSFAPSSIVATQGAAASTELTKTGAQNVEVDAQAATVSVARDGFTATTPEELAAAAAEVRRQQVAAEMASYGDSYSGPSVADYLANPPYPNFDLASVYNVALQYQGVPYVYGGATPAGFDCSGYIMYVYAQFGISLPHSSNGQGAAGTRISLADAVPGDLVIMPGHDGFYAGNGNILHAPYSGTSVRIQPIWTSDYYIVRIGI